MTRADPDLAVASVRDNFMILMPHLRKCLEEKHVPLLDNHAKVTTLPRIKGHIETRKGYIHIQRKDKLDLTDDQAASRLVKKVSMISHRILVVAL